MIGALRRLHHRNFISGASNLIGPPKIHRKFGALTSKAHAFAAENDAANDSKPGGKTHEKATESGLAADMFLRRGVKAKNLVQLHGWTAVEKAVSGFVDGAGPIGVEHLRNFLGTLRAVPQLEHRRKLAAIVKPELLRLFPTITLTDTVNCLYYMKLTVPRSVGYKGNNAENAEVEWLLQPVLARLAAEPVQKFKPDHVAKLYSALGRLSPDVDGMVQALEMTNRIARSMNATFSPQEMGLWLSAFRTMPLDVPAAHDAFKLVVATLQESLGKWTTMPAHDLTVMFHTLQMIGVESNESMQLASLLAKALERCTTANCIPLASAVLRCIHRAPPGSAVVEQLSMPLAQYLLLVDALSPPLRAHFICVANVNATTPGTQLLFQRLIRLLNNLPDVGKDALRPTELTQILEGARSLSPHSPELASLTEVISRKLTVAISRSHAGALSHAMAELTVLNHKLPGVPVILHKLAQSVRSVDDLVGVRWARCVSGLANMHSDCPEALEMLDALNTHLEKWNFAAPSSIVEIAQGIRNMDSSLPQVQHFVSNLMRHYFNSLNLPDQYLKFVEMKDIKLQAPLADQVVQTTTALLAAGRIPVTVGLLALRPIDRNHPKLKDAFAAVVRQLTRTSSSPVTFETMLCTMQSLCALQNTSLDTQPIVEMLVNQILDPDNLLNADEITTLCGAASGLSDDNSMVALILYHLTTRLAALREPLTEQQVIQALPIIESLSVNKSAQLLTTIASKLRDATFVPTSAEFVSALTHFRNHTSHSPAAQDLLTALGQRLSVMEVKVSPRVVCEALIAVAQCQPPPRLVDALLQRVDTAHPATVPMNVITELCRSFEGYKFAAAESREQFLALLTQSISCCEEQLAGDDLPLFLSKLQSIASNDRPYRTFVMSVVSKMDGTTPLSTEQLVECMNVLQHFTAPDAPAIPLLRYFTKHLAVMTENGAALAPDGIRTAFWSLQRMDSQFPAVVDLMQQLLHHLEAHPQVSADVIDGMLYGLRNKHSCSVVAHMLAMLADRIENITEPLHSRTLKALTTVRVWNGRDVSPEALRLASALATQLPHANIVLTPSLAKAVDAFHIRLSRSPHAETSRLRDTLSGLLSQARRS